MLKKAVPVTNLTELSEKKQEVFEAEFPFNFITGVDCGAMLKSHLKKTFEVNQRNGMLLIALQKVIYVLKIVEPRKKDDKPVHVIEQHHGQEVYEHVAWLLPSSNT